MKRALYALRLAQHWQYRPLSQYGWRYAHPLSFIFRDDPEHPKLRLMTWGRP